MKITLLTQQIAQIIINHMFLIFYSLYYIFIVFNKKNLLSNVICTAYNNRHNADVAMDTNTLCTDGKKANYKYDIIFQS